MNAARARSSRVPDAVQRFFSAAAQSRDPYRHLRDGPRLSSAPLRAALRPGNAVAPPEVYQTCLMKECGESPFLSCSGRSAALLQRCSAEPGPTAVRAARWTPDCTLGAPSG